MNMKRIAAIIGLIGMGACILCIVLAGFFPPLKDLFWIVGLMAFLVAVSISLIFTFRKQEEEQQPTPSDGEEEP